MRICFYIDTLNGTGGTERLTATLSNYLVSIGVNVYIISKRGGNKSFYQLDDRINIYSIYTDLDINIYKKYLTTIKIYRSIIAEIKPDFIINVGVNLCLETIPASLGKHSKIISWEHFNAKVYHNFYVNYLSKLLASKFSDKIVVLTDEDRIYYQQKFHAKRVLVISNPVPIDVGGHEYNSQSKCVLNIGRLTNQKGIDLLIKAWEIVNKKHPDWKLRIVGEGDQKEQLYQQVNDLILSDSIEFVAPSLHVIDHFKEAALFVMSSRYEGLPLILIEAKCFGLPIVSFDCDTGPRQIIINKQDGILIEPQNYIKLADAIIDLMGNVNLRINYSKMAIIDGKRFAPSIFYDNWKTLLGLN
ncbi:glycosyltransferase family 4 protein [Siphonobacter sp. SORGH_AS_0500]|uniref:glycosyltransferase family 4 protein n=1 Tax=Siphonobacter sp. SORGH_AS_0500 TaxID=1864824 RepID=UPI002866108D|nr:glycosyltransferase family 4 protein [Siphonobacter sp. SORGH_AS_0500]MDR6193708.1 glycosyltransferase involved in cell wall biosynthesis [Siphonobacter sp. SORGH_AS_0500]